MYKTNTCIIMHYILTFIPEKIMIFFFFFANKNHCISDTAAFVQLLFLYDFFEFLLQI